MIPPRITHAQKSFFSPGMPRPEQTRPRKGTRSCWECKRRKARCVMPAPPSMMPPSSPRAERACEACRVRGTQCVPQHLPDPGRSIGRSADRLGRVEEMLQKILRGESENGGDPSPTPSSSSDGVARGQLLGRRRGRRHQLGAFPVVVAGADSSASVDGRCEGNTNRERERLMMVVSTLPSSILFFPIILFLDLFS